MSARSQPLDSRQPAVAPRRQLPFNGVAALLTALALLVATLTAAPMAGASALAAPAAAPAVHGPGGAGSTGSAGAAQFALIVNGDDSFTHNYNVALALASLSQLGYAPRNTLVLAPAATAADGSAAAAGEPAPWRRPATEQGLKQAFAQLHERLRPGDLLLVYLTGHGYRMFGRTSLELQGGSITARELTQRLGELPFGKLILIADQCYSGGFANAALALGRDVVAVSSTDDRHEVRCEPFIRPFWLAALAALAPTTAESETKGNGFVSIEEAFQVAADGLRQAGAGGSGGGSGELPRIGASGNCSGRENTFSANLSTAAGDPGSGQRAGGATARR